MVRRSFIAVGIFGAFALAWVSGGNAARAQILPAPQTVSSEFPLAGQKIAFTPMSLNGSPLVTLRLDNKNEVTFLVSTGNPVSVVSATLVKKLGLTVQQRPEVNGAKTPIVTFASVEASAPTDTFKLVDAPFRVEETGSLNEYTDTVYGGVIGGNILQNFAVVFDYETNRIFLLGGNLNDEQLKSLRVADGIAGGVPMTAYDPDSLTFTVPVHVGKNTFPVLISSTSMITMVSDTTKRLKLDKADHFPGQFRSTDTPPYLLPVSDFGLGNGAPDGAKVSPLKPFDLGVNDAPNPSQPAVLGMDYLTHFRVIIDYPARKFYAAPTLNPEKRAYPNEASLQSAARSFQDGALYPSKEGKWIFTTVTKDGSLDMDGVENGDVIENVNGKKSDGLAIRSLMKLFTGRGDDRMLLLRDNKPVRVQLHWQLKTQL